MHKHFQHKETRKSEAHHSLAHKKRPFGRLLVRDRPSEEENVWLWGVEHIVNPSLALLNPETAPFCLRHQLSFGYVLGYVLWQHHVPGRKKRGHNVKSSSYYASSRGEHFLAIQLTYTRTSHRSTCQNNRWPLRQTFLANSRVESTDCFLRISAFSVNHARNGNFK